MHNFILSAFADEINPGLSTQISVLKKYGINHIEMRGVNGKNITKHTLDEVKEIKKELDDNGFKISAVGSPIGKIQITADFAPELDLFKHVLEQAKILDTKYIRMFSFFMPEGKNPADYRDEVMSRMQQYIDAAKGSGLVLLHENEKDIYGDTAERCLDLLKTLNCDYLKATFDPANFVQCGVAPFPHAYEMLKDYIIYYHIKDARAADGQVTPSGYGDGGLPQLIEELKATSFNGFLSFEPHLGDFTGFAELENGKTYENKPASGESLFDVAYTALKRFL